MTTDCLLRFALCLVVAAALVPMSASGAEALGVNVRDLGAKGDGKADDTEAVQKAIDQAALTGADALAKAPSVVVFPPGHYRITAPLKLKAGIKAIHLKGTGGVDSFGGSPATNAKRVPRGTTQLLYDGPEGGNLVEVFGVGGLRIDNLVLVGQKKAGTLLRVNSPKGHGAGRYHIESVTFAEADTGISCGDDSYINSADMTFVSIMFKELTTGFRLHSGQNIDYCFIRPHANTTETVFHIVRGGNVQVTMGTAVNCRLAARIDSGGWNVGNYHFDTLHIETAGKTAYQVLKASGQVNVVFTSLNAQTQRAARTAGDKRPLFELSGGAMVVVTGGMISNGPVAKISGDDGQPTFLQFRNSRFYATQPFGGDPFTTIEHDAKSGYEVVNSIIQDGKTTHFVKTRGAYPPEKTERE